MTRLYFILFFYFIISFAFGQSRLCDDCDSLRINEKPYVKKEHKKYKKASCNLKKYKDTNAAKKMYCEAMYYSSIQRYYNSVELLKLAYAKANSKEFKYQILKMTAENCKKSGDNRGWQTYQDKVNAILSKFPDIEK
jgi:hypothetical protein